MWLLSGSLSVPFGLGRHVGSTAGGLSSSLPPTVRPWAGDPRPSHRQSQASAVRAPWGRSPPLHASLGPRVGGGPILAVPCAPHRPVGTVCGPGGKPAELLGLTSQGSKASICSLESTPCHCQEWGEALSGGSGWLAVFFLHPLCPPNSASQGRMGDSVPAPMVSGGPPPQATEGPLAQSPVLHPHPTTVPGLGWALPLASLTLPSPERPAVHACPPL